MSVFQIGKGDLTPDMVIEINSGEDISDAADFELRVRKPDDSTAVWTLTAVNLATGQIKREWAAGDTDTPGIHSGIVTMTRGGKQQTYPADGTRLQWIVHPGIG